jgi:hypothetical protein
MVLYVGRASVETSRWRVGGRETGIQFAAQRDRIERFSAEMSACCRRIATWAHRLGGQHRDPACGGAVLSLEGNTALDLIR